MREFLNSNRKASTRSLTDPKLLHAYSGYVTGKQAPAYLTARWRTHAPAITMFRAHSQRLLTMGNRPTRTLYKL